MQIKTFTIVFAYVRVFAPHFALASHLNEIIFEKKALQALTVTWAIQTGKYTKKCNNTNWQL